MKQSHQPRSGLHPPDSPDVTHFGVNPFLIQPMVGIRRLMPTMGYRIKPLCGKNNEAPTESSEEPKRIQHSIHPKGESLCLQETHASSSLHGLHGKISTAGFSFNCYTSK